MLELFCQTFPSAEQEAFCLLSSVHAGLQGKGTVPENHVNLAGGLWVPGIGNILVSRQDSDWRGAESPVPPAEDVLHSLCVPGASKPPCTLSPVCAFPFADFCPVLLNVLV